MTLLEKISSTEVRPLLSKVASAEGADPSALAENVRTGRAVVVANNRRRSVRPLGIGRGLGVKVNANVGTSTDLVSISEEIAKTRAAVEAGADTIMDLSTGGNLSEVRREIMSAVDVPIGTVPIYEVAVSARRRGKSFCEAKSEEFFEVIERQLDEGVDFITVHCGVNRESLGRLRNEGRVMGVVSRGGALTIEWMEYNRRENPLFERFDELLRIAAKYDAVLSLGDGIRPGSVVDATDRGQVQELITLGELAGRALAAGVQVMIEGPGHVPLDQIEANVLLEKKLCHGAPFYVLGPLVTDVAAGFDHIAGAIGGAVAALAGADFLCYVTPSEHLRLPDVEDVRAGVIASRIAAHAADLARGGKAALDRDREMSLARKALDWEKQIALSIDPPTARRLRDSRKAADGEVCTMCGELCAIKIQKK